VTHGLYSAAAAGLLAWGTGIADAQIAATTGLPSATANTSAVGEVIVTAQKRAEKLNTVPISITAVSGEQLNNTASKNLEELSGVIPGVTIPAATAYGGSSIVIRGTSGSATFLEDDPVAVYVDGIYQASNSRFGVSDLTDVQSVEVVRGPQGTLQGRNATAGAILVRTNDPGSTFGGYLRASIGTPLEYRAEGAVTVPVNDTFRLRLSGDYYDQRGWALNTYDDSHLGGMSATNVRAVALWTPTSRFTARLALDYQTLINKQASQRWASTAVNPTGTAENLAAPTPFVPLPASLQSYYLNGNRVYNAIPSKNSQRSPSLALEMHYDFGPVELVSLTGVSSAVNKGSTDSGGLGATGTNGVSVIDAVTGERRQAFNVGKITGNQETEEVRLQSKGADKFSYILGVYGSHAIDDMSFDIFDYNLAGSGDGDVGFRSHQRDYSEAAFADATYNLTSKLSLTGGVRYTAEQKTFRNTFSVTVPEIQLVVVGPIPYAPPTGHWEDVSYRGNVKYQFTSDTMVYVSYSKGFKSGGFNAFGVGPTPSYDPETLHSLEVGAKTYFLDRRGYIAASGYDNIYDNLQVTAGVPSGGVNVYNAATAKIKGFEIEGQFKITPALSVAANMSYTDSYYSSFANGQGVDGNLINATGNELPNSPKYQYYIEGDYQIALKSDWQAHAQVSYRWRDKVYFFGTNEESNLTGAPDGELGARLDVTNTRALVTVSVFGRNLTDTRVVTGEQADFAYPVAFFNEPREVGFELTKKF
jgi:iron complex outermembrane receptor protein